MKNKFSKYLLSVAIITIMVLTFNLNSNKLNQKTVSLKNIMALNEAQAQAELDCSPQYSCGFVSTETCYEIVYPYYRREIGYLVGVTFPCL